ncbi:MAG: hypothetical protein JWN40_3719 [Phycisphaerales bacterium]|nr:hypothetical protein [Phycisphaerales bacterium]
MRHHLTLGCMIVTFLITATAAIAADRNPTTHPAATQPDRGVPAIKQLLAQLAADNYLTRENARVSHMGLKRTELPALRDAVRQYLPLVPSQVTVLREIVTQVYLAGDLYVAEEDGRGFLGVHLPEERSLLIVERGVVVVSRLPGFCAYRMLQDGDVLLSMADGHGGAIEFGSSDQLKDAVSSAKAGDTIHFEVLRQGQILSIPITLDQKPVNLDKQIAEFTARRADQANDLWERDFAPLLVETLG